MEWCKIIYSHDIQFLVSKDYNQVSIVIETQNSIVGYFDVILNCGNDHDYMEELYENIDEDMVWGYYQELTKTLN